MKRLTQLEDINININNLNDLLNPPKPIVFTSVGFSVPVG
jgi:hypothetical protein